MPLDVCADWSNLITSNNSCFKLDLSKKLTDSSSSLAVGEFENFINVLRTATVKYRLKTTESEALMSDYLRNRFNEKHKKLDNNSIEWIYDLVHPVKGNITVCRRAWIGCFGVSWQKVRFAQQCVKDGYLRSSVGCIEDKDVTLKSAFEQFGLDYNDYIRSFDNYMDITKVSETEGSLLATAWLSREFDAVGEAQPDEDVILIDYVEEKDVYERYKNDKQIRSITKNIISYCEFCRIWREVFPKVNLMNDNYIKLFYYCSTYILLYKI